MIDVCVYGCHASITIRLCLLKQACHLEVCFNQTSQMRKCLGFDPRIFSRFSSRDDTLLNNSCLIENIYGTDDILIVQNTGNSLKSR